MDPKRIRQAREQKKVTQAKLADWIGVTPSQVSRFESGKRRIHLDEATKIAEILGLDISELRESKNAPAWRQHGVRISLLTLPEGRAIVEYPAELSTQSRDAIKQWLELVGRLVGQK